ncbi:MAG: carbamoyltransferase [Spirochaetales bacterium]|nr:carbamoyltransferase [Spirochaetales bacterium]
MNILGISALYHDSAAALVKDGDIVAAAQEERFTRNKHDQRFPESAIAYCLKEGNIGKNDLDAVVFYDKPIKKFARILTTYTNIAPLGVRSATEALPIWIKQKLWVPLLIEEILHKSGIVMPDDLYFLDHHQSHAASAFFPSPFERAAILTIDGVGEWTTSAIGRGSGNRFELIKELRFPHSLGLLYSAFTYYVGFRVNSGEYKLMGLAPYGKPLYVDRILEKLVDLKNDGSFRLNMDYFSYLSGMRMINKKFERLFDGPPRKPETEITRREMDIARSIQEVTEMIVLRMANHTKEVTGEEYLCLAGGVALNCVANGKIVQEQMFKDIWIQPAAGDAGGALGAALMVWYQICGNERRPDNKNDSMKGAYLGPSYSDDDIDAFLKQNNYPAHRLSDRMWPQIISQQIDKGKVVGVFTGRMEFGPRALGSRSIIGDARSPEMQLIMNKKIKARESFRPFAPSCLEEDCGEFFELDRPSPYMLLVAPVVKKRRHNPAPTDDLTIRQRINTKRSDIPAITHVDYSARIQTVGNTHHPRYYEIIKAFRNLTGYGIIINTSFNVRGEPIVCSPEDAYRCFMRTQMDCLVLGSYILYKEEQPDHSKSEKWQYDTILD